MVPVLEVCEVEKLRIGDLRFGSLEVVERWRSVGIWKDEWVRTYARQGQRRLYQSSAILVTYSYRSCVNP